ncbi:MAG TPA: HlyD family secretion protein [Anaeromyxobacteraceae bacterium]|nr:HlyD family secretion protein [Anaeromyxobacteraceae bacterium]
MADGDATTVERARTAPPAAEAAGKPPARRGALRKRLAVGGAVVGAAGLLWWLHARQYEDTDDAQVDGYIASVSPRVPGTVTAVHVVDDQRVKTGDVLVELDPTDLEVAVAQARAAVAQAQAALEAEAPSVSITETSNLAAVRAADADVESARSDLEASQREVDQAAATARLAESNLARAKQLVEGQSLAPAEYDQRVAAADVARAALASAQQRLAGRKARLDTSLTRQRETFQNAPRQLVTREASVQVRQANLEAAQAQLRQAQLNLSYARVTASADGIVGKRGVNVGERVQPGQQLMALTLTGELWVTANFRETQIDRMRPGQAADVHVDALSRSYRATVETFAGATGSRYSLLPPENATGNYVKVVQRVPVRVRLEPGQPEIDRLRPGLSVEVTVKVR